MRLLPCLLVAALVLAGCLQPADDSAAATVEPASTAGPATVPGAVVPANVTVTNATGASVPLPPAPPAFEVRLAATGYEAAEPTLGVTSDGTLFTSMSGEGIGRSKDHGRTWETLDTGDALLRPKANLDPWLWVDPLTDRVFNGPLYVVCTWLSWSDDGGGSWENNPLAGCGVPAHDHQKITTGPPTEGVQTDGYPNVVYYSYNSFRQEGTWISTSLDGGETFGLGQAVHAPDDCHSGVAGPVAVGPDGTAYSPKATCDGVDVAVSRDSGETWEKPVSIDGAGVLQALANNPDVSVDSEGNAYLVFNGKDGRIHMSRTTDQGKTWSEPVVVSPPQVQATSFSVVVAGDPGRVAFGYLGTTADASKWKTRDAENADDKAVWHLYLTFSEDALAESPSFTSLQLTPDDDPVQIGCIWQSGGAEACRNLYDFFDMVEHEGRVYLVYADGCDECKSADQSRRTDGYVAIVERGISLRGGLVEPLSAEEAEDAEEKDEGFLAVARR